MNGITAFKNSLLSDAPPAALSVYLKALWQDGKGNWDKAHNLIDDLEDETACWVHAYLHRKEGDTWNAGYWYRKANKKRPNTTLQEEWVLIVKALL